MKNISVVGIGKLGLCFALSLEKSGHNVWGVDLSQAYIDSLNEKVYRTSEPLVEEYLKSSKHFYPTTDLRHAVFCSDIIFLVVATPSLPDGKYDHSQIESVVQKLKQIPLQGRKNLVVCCTVMPGYTDTLQTQLESHGWDVSYNPEFIAQGTIIVNQENPDMVLIGEANLNAGNEIESIYRTMVKNTPKFARMSRISAELTKIGLNCFLINKIAYANMLGDLAATIGADTEQVLSAIASDSRVGKKFFSYGFGYGGPCLPRDGRVLSAVAGENNCNHLYGKIPDLSNKLHLEKQLELFLQQTPDKTKEIVFSYVTYKPESILIEESQQLQYVLKLVSLGYTNIVVHERAEVIEQVNKQYPNNGIKFIERQ